MIFEFKKVLVTGGAGCIGMAVCSELRKRKIDVVLFDLYEQIQRVSSFIDDGIVVNYGSILDTSSLRDAIKGCDAVIHLAAYLGVKRTEINSLRCLEINIDGTRNVLDACLTEPLVKKVIFASSSEVYGEPSHNPVCEDDHTQGKTVYAVSKLAGEELVKAFGLEYENLDYTILRYFNTYGPHQVAQFVVPRFIKNVAEGRSPIIFGDGLQERSYNYSEDTAIGTVDALVNTDANGYVLNIGNSKGLVNLRDLASLVIELSGKTNSIRVKTMNTFDNTDRNENREIFKRYCSTELAQSLIGYSPKYSLSQGLKKVIEMGHIESGWATVERSYNIDD